MFEDVTQNARRLGSSTNMDCEGPLLRQNGVLHHLGFVVASISKVAEQFTLSMAACWDGQIIYDPLQRVRVAFFIPLDS